MINLKKYFDDNVETNEYYFYKFGNYQFVCEMDKYNLFDEEEIISELKKLLYPYNKGYSIEEEMFIYLCFYLCSNDYIIDEFPNFLKKPTNRWNLSYDMIRNSIIKRDGYSGVVTWADRRIFIDNMNIRQNATKNISKDINRIIQGISTRNATFQEMSIDEKLKEICNCIEYLLKENGTFKVIDYDDSCGYLSDETVKKYRNKLECFRHATTESIEERKKYSIEQKEFLIEYGIIILNYIKNKISLKN